MHLAFGSPGGDHSVLSATVQHFAPRFIAKFLVESMGLQGDQ